MRADKADEDDARIVVDFNDEPKIVAPNIEDNSVTRPNISRGEGVLDVLKFLPLGCLCLVKPCSKGLLRAGVFRPEVL